MESLKELIAALYAFDPKLQWQAAGKLAKIQTPELKAPLLEALQNPRRRVRQVAMVASCYMKEADFIPPLAYILSKDDDFLRRDAGRNLGFMHEMGLPALLEALNSGDVRARRYAAEGLGRGKQAGAVTGLIDALRKEPMDSRLSNSAAYAIMFAMREIGDSAAIPVLLEVMPRIPDSIIGSLLGAFQKLKAVESIPALIILIHNPSTSDNTRYGAIRTLGVLGDDSVIPELLKLLKAKDQLIRYRAVDALSNFKTAPVVSAVIAALKDEDVSVQSGAIDALGKLKDPSAVPHIVKAMKRKDQWNIVRILQNVNAPQFLVDMAAAWFKKNKKDQIDVGGEQAIKVLEAI
jgi:HEAT repeat protein